MGARKEIEEERTKRIRKWRTITFASVGKSSNVRAHRWSAADHDFILSIYSPLRGFDE